MFHQTGARKKKRLTDPVKIIPFPDQALRSKAPKAGTKPKIKEEQAPVTVIPTPKELKQPAGNLKSSRLSIKQMLQPKEEDEDAGIDLSNMPQEPYSFDDLKMAWNRFAFEMKNEGKETFFSALRRREPVVKSEHQYILQVDNVAQADIIRPQIADMLGFIRKTLKNYSVVISVETTDNPDEEVKFLTGKDKFAKMARKNPNLHTLKNTFNLDIEY